MKDNLKNKKIIGIDYSTNHKKVGLALGDFTGRMVKIQEVAVDSKDNSIVKIIAGWIIENKPTILAIDAPLGWPANLSKYLLNHQAGEPIYADPNLIFRRLTDRIVKKEIGKQPLDVGADRIARQPIRPCI